VSVIQFRAAAAGFSFNGTIVYYEHFPLGLANVSNRAVAVEKS
jgi:hypothetical protein